MIRENFYTLHEMDERISQLNIAETIEDIEEECCVRRSYAMHTPEVNASRGVGRPEDARCRYFAHSN